LARLGLSRKSRDVTRRHRFGLRRHVDVEPWSDKVEVYWRDRCELYVTPVDGRCVNLAILSWSPFGFEQGLDLFPEVKAKLADSKWNDAPAGRSPLYHSSARVQKGRILVAGDAALFIDAMTGEGNTLALKSGIAAAKAVVKGRPALYRWYWMVVVWRYCLITLPVLKASQSVWLRRRLLTLLAEYPFLLRWGVRFLSGDRV
jgi:hypothetical protein